MLFKKEIIFSGIILACLSGYANTNKDQKDMLNTEYVPKQ